MLLLALVGPAAAQSPFSNGSGGDFPPVEEAFPFTAWAEDGELVLNWDVTPEYYLYEDRISIETEPADALALPPRFSIDSEIKDDPYFGKTPVFYEPVSASLSPTEGDGDGPIRVTVEWQGCAEAGLCYTPQTETLRYNPADGSVMYPAPEQDTASSASGGSDSSSPSGGDDGRWRGGSLETLLSSDSLLWAMLVFYGLGLGLTFTPCVLPMIPIVSAVVAGQRQLNTLQAFYLSLAYVLGMALTYAAAGVLVGLLGASFNIQAHLQAPWVLALFAGLFTLLALAMFGVFEIRLPQRVMNRLTRQSERLSGGNVAGVAGIGALSALIVSPCVTAPLAAALVYLSATQNATMGGLALFALALGMGTPLILVGTGGRRFMPQPGPWMNRIKAAFGILMLAVAIWLLERVIPGPAALVLWALLLAVTGVQLGAFEPLGEGWPRTRKGIGVVLVLVAAMLLAGAMAGASDPLRPLEPFHAGSGSGGAGLPEEPFERVSEAGRIEARLEQAAEAGKPVILDFYADWCISCKVMERQVFDTEPVLEAMKGFERLQVDVTDNTAADQALLDRFNLFGPPTLLFFNAQGEELKQARILGEMDQDEFLEHLERVRERTGV
ncbi:protein-disulfide reductase DsbD [Halovibrio salipaludis]|uniref:protein-disulfide reductase DsbD n=1 Tax=Halovibrio salipaludis TaxID=2032626 RepID=UPI0022B8C564|nr:protein-disulfide reductase DsbD [Halovibrio salipaludis]